MEILFDSYVKCIYIYTNSSMDQQSRLEEKVDIDRRYSTRNHIKNHSRIIIIEANMTAETSWLGLSKKGRSLECNRCSILRFKKTNKWKVSTHHEFISWICLR